MSTKNIYYLLIFIVLLALAGWLYSRRSTSILDRKMNYDFTIKDTAAIDKIIIEDKSPAKVILTRSVDGWKVNGKFNVRKDAIEILLGTLYRMEMRNFIPENLRQIVIKRLSVFGKKVQVYKTGRLYKTFYVGTNSQDEMATYMMIKGANAPYAVHIPGFNGFLSTRFFVDTHLWRSRDLIEIDPANIREVKMYYPDSVTASFKINVYNFDSLFVTGLEDGKIIRSINKVNAQLFLSAFKNLKYEGAIIPTDQIWQRRDSLLASIPVFRLEVKDINGKKTTVSGYKIKGSILPIEEGEEEAEFDPDRMHGFINDERMILLQYYGLKNLLKSLEFFVKS